MSCGCRFGSRAGLLAIMAASLLQGCAEQQATGPTARVFATDQMGGARNCSAPKVVPAAGQETPVSIKLGNDGGWCAISVNNAGKPYTAGLLVTEPAHGKVLVHTVGSDTRIDYTPGARYAGADAFAVKLIPGDAVIRVTATVTLP